MELPLEIPQDILDARRFDRVYLSEQTLERGGDTGDLKRPEKNRGLIIDLRYYPSQDFNEFVSQYIVPDSVKYTVRFTYPDLALPGVFYARDYSYPTYKTEKYNAPIIIMVNEGTQSYGETSVQKIQNNPYTITIGSQSAGADGNISKFTLPRGVLGAFSGLGW